MAKGYTVHKIIKYYDRLPSLEIQMSQSWFDCFLIISLFPFPYYQYLKKKNNFIIIAVAVLTRHACETKEVSAPPNDWGPLARVPLINQ